MLVSSHPTIVASDLRRLVETDGGFTIAVVTGRRVQHGVSVCLRPSRSLSFWWDEWSDREVTAWLTACGGDRVRPAAHIGGWIDPRSQRVWLDPVTVVAPLLRRAACVVATALDQRCVYDLGRRELVVVGGRSR